MLAPVNVCRRFETRRPRRVRLTPVRQVPHADRLRRPRARAASSPVRVRSPRYRRNKNNNDVGEAVSPTIRFYSIKIFPAYDVLGARFVLVQPLCCCDWQQKLSVIWVNDGKFWRGRNRTRPHGIFWGSGSHPIEASKPGVEAPASCPASRLLELLRGLGGEVLAVLNVRALLPHLVAHSRKLAVDAREGRPQGPGLPGGAGRQRIGRLRADLTALSNGAAQELLGRAALARHLARACKTCGKSR